MVTFWERAVQPVVFALILTRFGGARAIEGARTPADVVANGQCFLMTREAYDAIGGHAAVRDTVAEDLMMAQRTVMAGRRVSLALGRDQLSTRMYDGLDSLVRGWRKNVYAGGRLAMKGGLLGRLLFPLALVGFPLAIAAPFVVLPVLALPLWVWPLLTGAAVPAVAASPMLTTTLAWSMRQRPWPCCSPSPARPRSGASRSGAPCSRPWARSPSPRSAPRRSRADSRWSGRGARTGADDARRELPRRLHRDAARVSVTRTHACRCRVLTIRAAATLLARSDSLENARPLLRALGFSAPLHRARRRPAPCARPRRRDRAGPRLRRGSAPCAPSWRSCPPVAMPATSRDASPRRSIATPAGSAWLLCLLHAATHAAHARRRHRQPRARRRGSPCSASTATTSPTATPIRCAPSPPSRATTHQFTYARWTDILGRDALSARFYRTLDRLVRRWRRRPPEAATADETPHARAALRVPPALPRLPRGQGMARRRSRLPRCANAPAALERAASCTSACSARSSSARSTHPWRDARRPPARFGRVPFLNGGLFAQAALERQRRRTCASPTTPSSRSSATCSTAIASPPTKTPRPGPRPRSTPRCSAAPSSRSWRPRERRGSGTFYTPPALVERVIERSAARSHSAAPTGPRASARSHAAHRPASRTRLGSACARCASSIPACGSGAFLVHALERLTALRVAAGDARPLAEVRRDVLSRLHLRRGPQPDGRLALRAAPLALRGDRLRGNATRCACHRSPISTTTCASAIRSPAATSASHRATGRRLAQLRARYVQARRHAASARWRAALDREERGARRSPNSARTVAQLRAERAALLARLRARDLFGERAPVTRADTRAPARTARRAAGAAGSASAGSRWAAHSPSASPRTSPTWARAAASTW